MKIGPTSIGGPVSGKIGPPASNGGPASGRSIITHTPAVHIWPSGHVTPSHESTQAPATQWVPAPHETPAQPGGMHAPVAVSHVSPPVQAPPSVQRVTQVPASHTLQSSQVRPVQGLKQRPASQT